MRDDALALDQDTINLIESVRTAFNKISNRGYGAFNADQTAYPLSGEISNYLDKGIAIFSRRLETMYKKILDSAQASTGGYLFFVKYIENNDDFLIIFSLNNRASSSVNDSDLTIKKSVTLDIEHLKEAARINLTSWKEGKDSYITFIKKRKNNTDTSSTNYFREFLGVTEITESKSLTQQLLRAVEEYCTKLGKTQEQKKQIKETLHQYCSDCTKSKKGVNLSSLSMLLNENSPDEFSDFINSCQEYTISDDFEPHQPTYRTLKRYRIKDSNLTLDFDASIFGTRVIYDDEKNCIIITEIPSDLRSSLLGN